MAIMADLFVLVEDMSWFDSHCHLQGFLRKGELEEVLQRAEDAGVRQMVAVGTSPADWADYLSLAKRFPGRIHHSVGLHPGYVEGDWEEKTRGLTDFWSEPVRPVALGEIGLDYFHLPKDPEAAERTVGWQKDALRRQLLWAKEWDCPVIVHSRSAFEDCVKEIDRSGVNWERIVFHCFSEGVPQVECLMERGALASFTGMITFPRNLELVEAAKRQGLDRLMLETDSPYLAPVPHRGRGNEPAYLPAVGSFLAQAIGVSSDRVMNASFERAEIFYRMNSNRFRESSPLS